MAAREDYPDGPGYTRAAGFGSQQQGRRPPLQPAATPPQFRRDEPQQAPPPAPSFTPGYRPAPQGQQPAWQQPYPPQSYAPPSPQPPRKSRKGLVGLGCGGAFAIFILIVALVSSPPSPSSPPAQQPGTTAPAQAAPAAPKTVATFTGSGITSTPPFTVTSAWRLDWSFNCSSFGQSGNFIIMEDGSYGAMDVDELALEKSGSSYAYNDPGQHYIEVNSECDWSLKVVDEG